jgi:hypothetical protein
MWMCWYRVLFSRVLFQWVGALFHLYVWLGVVLFVNTQGLGDLLLAEVWKSNYMTDKWNLFLKTPLRLENKVLKKRVVFSFNFLGQNCKQKTMPYGFFPFIGLSFYWTFTIISPSVFIINFLCWFMHLFCKYCMFRHYSPIDHWWLQQISKS